MNDFILQCLDELEPLTGIRQLYFLQSDPEGERKIQVLIKGILMTCQQFPYIPEEAQKKIIREHMVKDQDYEALNSRTVWKWLNMNKDVWWAKEQAAEPSETPPEPMSEETKKMVDKFMADLAAGMQDRTRPKFAERLKQEMEKIAQEDKERTEGNRLAEFQTSELEAEKKALHLQYLKENYDPITGKKFETWMEESDWIAQQL